MVKRLGEILIERGVLALSELHTGLEACRRSGGRLGTHLLRFGFVDEPALLEALAEQTGVRAVSTAALRSAPIDVLSLLTPGMARRLGAVPFERTAHHVCVAMVSPRDPVAAEDISRATGLEVIPCVSTESAILEAIARLDGAPAAGAPVEEREPPSDWDRLWTAPRADPGDLLGIRRTAPAPAGSRLQIATFPGLASVTPEGMLEEDHSIDETAFRQRLARVETRDDVGRLMLGYAQGFFSRVCLFAVHRGAVVGWMARGQGVVVDDVQTFSVPLEELPLFREFRYGTGYHLGPIPDDDHGLARLLGEPRPLSVLLLPIRVRDRAVAFLLGDNPHEEAAVPAEQVAATIAAAGLAFEVLILRKKITG